MTETTSEVRADIDQTRARISGAIAELENKVDVAQRVKEHPWVAVGIAFGAGFRFRRFDRLQIGVSDGSWSCRRTHSARRYREGVRRGDHA